MVTCEPAVFTVLQHARQGDVTDPKPIMEALDKLSDSVPVATPPPELARFLRLENTGKTEQFPLPKPANVFPLVPVEVELSLGITPAAAEVAAASKINPTSK